MDNITEGKESAMALIQHLSILGTQLILCYHGEDHKNLIHFLTSHGLEQVGPPACTRWEKERNADYGTGHRTGDLRSFCVPKEKRDQQIPPALCYCCVAFKISEK